ncbi:MAG: hypothetical protein AB8B60_16040 [Sulfitobacter sp.]
MMMRVVFSLTLALMLALTSQAMAVARGSSAATGQMVLCIGDEAVAVFVDAEGQPTRAPHLCPDCVVNLAVGPFEPFVTLPRAVERAVSCPQLPLLAVAKPKGLVPHTRAPPAFA